ncbi:MAG: hypothetical protein L0191_05725 [Acidobacteria bacterium]|nr:hypothetical protein [Acidobacteriota bacterium]
MAADAVEAVKCFEENLAMVGDPEKDREKYNLYQGLAGIADGILHVESGIRVLVQEIVKLQSKVDRLTP